jgi:hypothetical protein
MTPFVAGFLDELEKCGGVGKALLGTAVKHPLLTLGGLSVGGAAALSAAQGYKSGLKGGEKGKFLQAEKDKPSDAFFTNYHQLFEHKPKPWQKERQSWNYNEQAFKR